MFEDIQDFFVKFVELIKDAVSSVLDTLDDLSLKGSRSKLWTRIIDWVF